MRSPGELSRVPVARPATPSSEIWLCVNPGISMPQNFSSEYCIPDHSKVCWQFSCHTQCNKNTVKWTRAFSLHPVRNSFRYISKALLTIISTEVLPQMATATYSQFIFANFSFRHCYFLIALSESKDLFITQLWQQLPFPGHCHRFM